MKLAPDSPTGLGAMMAGGRTAAVTTSRNAWDYYPTPAECTRALLIAEAHHMRMHGTAMWEPCAYGGQIVGEAKAAGFDVFASDIRADPARQVAPMDLLATTRRVAPIILTNFPWTHAADMIDHVLDTLRAPYLCALFKTQYWQTCTEAGRGRLDLFRRHPPNMRWDCTWRVNFQPGKRNPISNKKCSSPMNVSWFVWDTNRAGQRNWNLLDRTGPVGIGHAKTHAQHKDEL